MPLSSFDAREVTMHYKRKGDRVDEVLHDIVLNHVNRLEHENKRLKEALDASEKHLMTAERHLRDFKEFEFEERTEKVRLREALETINRRTMSQYLSVDNMVMDFKKIARQALEGDKQ